MKTILEVVHLTSDYLKQKNVPSFKREAEALIASALGLKRMDIYLHFDRKLTESDLKICHDFLKRRAAREPLEYITESTTFMNLELKVNQRVLIPRSETEILVEMVIKTLRTKDLKNKVLWDVCTGSGCIALALKYAFPDLKVVASDLCAQALEIADYNAQKHGLDVEFVQGDFLNPFKGKCDFLVCNPPYISEEEYLTLDPEVTQFEPKKACIGQDNGLEFYKKMAEEWEGKTHPQALGWMEIGYNQKKAVLGLFQKKEFNCSVLPDWSGKDRFFLLETDRSDQVS